MAKPNLPDITMFLQAGIDPKTRLPLKFGGSSKTLKKDILARIRINHESEIVNRFQWYNLPCDITSQELERMLFYKYQLALFFIPELEKFYFMPFALDGTIDFYGRYNTIHPVPMTSGTDDEKNKAQAAFLSTVKRDVVYGIKAPEEIDVDTLINSAVILRDYTPQLSQSGIPRANLDEPILNMMAECLPLARTNAFANSGIKTIRVSNADDQYNVELANREVEEAALEGRMYIAAIGSTEFQDMTGTTGMDTTDYFQMYQSLDNLRKQLSGLEASGVFEKSSHTLNAEQNMNAATTVLTLSDGLAQRQNFCNIVNAIWGLGIWCEPNESIVMADINGDGVDYQRQDEPAPNDGGGEYEN